MPMASPKIYGLRSPQELQNRSQSASRDPGLKILRVKVVAGIDLAKKDIFGLSDPYCKIRLFRGDRTAGEIDSITTETIKKTLTPKWNEEFLFRVNPIDNRLLFEVFDENRLTRDDFLGEVEIPSLGSYPTERRNVRILDKDYRLRKRSERSRVKGHLRLRLSFLPEEPPQQTTTGGKYHSIQFSSSPTNSTDSAHRHSVEKQPPPLPEGWEERQDANGRTFYIDHTTRTTTWVRPSRHDTDAHADTLQSRMQTHMQSRMQTRTQARYRHARRHATDTHVDAHADTHADTHAVTHAGTLQTRTQARYRHAYAHADTHVDTIQTRMQTHMQTCYRHACRHATNKHADTHADAHADTLQTHMQTRFKHACRRTCGHSTDTHVDAHADTHADTCRYAGRHVTDTQADTHADTQADTHADTHADTLQTRMQTRYRHACRHAADTHTLQTRMTDAHADTLQSRMQTHMQSRMQTRTQARYRHARRHATDTHVDAHADTHADTHAETTQNALMDPLPPGWAVQRAPNGRLFFIDHNSRTTTWHDPRLTHLSQSPPSALPPSAPPAQDLGPLPDGWEERIHSDGRVFYIDHETRSTQWEDPRLQLNTTSQAVPYSRDYKRKCDYFRSKLKRPSNVPNKYEIHIRRRNLMEDSYRAVQLSIVKPEILKSRLWIVFDGETGLDYGGLQREWFYLLSKEVFNPYYGLFEYSASDNYTLQINPNSGLCNEEHLSYFKFIGRVAGMAVYHGKLLDAFFIRPFYKMMLGRPITLIDMESVDSEYYNSLNWILENDPEDLDLHFCVDEELFGILSVKDLKPNGSQTNVTNENKREYINLVIKWRFVSRVEDQMRAFMEGFCDLIPHNLIQIFDERELELLMCGLGEIDTVDWRKNSNYRGEYHDKHIVIQWFWKAVNSFDIETRARLLQFVTGTSRVPMNGFSELYGSNGPQRFTIEPWGTPHSLPRAHTCFNRLDLPRYRSYYELRERLRIAIENTQGFEGVD
ncbi:predicted protein [Nematostella vectensis]|uniref:HECT-type E3 ubiquitin transferase n=1 Tax=Nematostella vectensis TaxID=45351 RepID=A7RR93_NEMVE|nr:predicted protein [Nematostella vectensis]|eukprot:XP_001638134.1 predicted protein [Nematostella vectensis]